MCDAARKIWPELSPYGGKYNDSRPHVTLALGEMQPGDQEAIAELARPFLPLAVYTDYLHVVAFDGRKWAVRRKFSCGQGG